MSSTTEQALHRTMAATFEELGLIVPNLQPSPAQSAVSMDFAVSGVSQAGQRSPTSSWSSDTA